MKQRHILILGIFLIIALDLTAQKLSVETLIDTNIITLGDQISLKYRIEKQKEIRTWLPVFSDSLAGGIEIISAVVDSSSSDDQMKITVDLTITSFDTGIYYIPPQPIPFRDGGYTDTLKSRATYLMVIGVPIDTTFTVRDIKAIEPMPLSLNELAMYVLILAFIAAAIWLVVYIIRRRKQEKPLFKPLRPEEPPYITAFRELDKLKAMKLWQQKQIKEYYTRITYIIRWYIEKRFLIKALEQTSDEILDHIKGVKIDDINYSNLESLLNLADLVKFARGEPDPEENMLHLDNAYDFIRKTKENVTANSESVDNKKS